MVKQLFQTQRYLKALQFFLNNSIHFSKKPKQKHPLQDS